MKKFVIKYFKEDMTCNLDLIKSHCIEAVNDEQAGLKGRVYALENLISYDVLRVLSFKGQKGGRMKPEQIDVLNAMKDNESMMLAAYYDTAHAKIATTRLFVGKQKPGIRNDELLDVIKRFLDEQTCDNAGE